LIPVAERLTLLLRDFFGGELPIRLRAWDGSEAGPHDAPVVVLRSRRALRRLVWQPDELGLAQAYISGDLDIEGDLGEGLSAVWRAVRERGLSGATAGLADRARAAAAAVRLGAVGPRPPEPGARRAKLRGALHSTARDRSAISHHYDLSNDFYAALLDETMAYSCGYWTRPDDPSYGPVDSQHDKLELICRKLGLTPGARLLDIGCGWGSLTLYAAREFKARVTAVTLSRQQRDFVAARVREQGLEELVEVELRHYRDIDADPGSFDAVSTVEMGEHVGDDAYPAFAALLFRMLKPRGRLFVQQMSRGANAPGGGAFIESYIAPDMHMRPVGDTLNLLEGAGFEVRAAESLREHYVRTVAAWHRTLEDDWDTFVGMVGEPTARVWRLYLVGGGLAFAERRMGVDQIVAVRPTREGEAAMPATLRDWYDLDDRDRHDLGAPDGTGGGAGRAEGPR
jgi:cyclopropane-fatty-acyl-phospholipid synthase